MPIKINDNYLGYIEAFQRAAELESQALHLKKSDFRKEANSNKKLSKNHKAYDTYHLTKNEKHNPFFLLVMLPLILFSYMPTYPFTWRISLIKKPEVVPVSHAAFSQDKFIACVNDQYGNPLSLPSGVAHLWNKLTKTPLLNEKGICLVLTLLWYEKLRKGKNLLDDLRDNEISKDDMFYLRTVQEKYAPTHFKYSDDFQKILSKHHSEHDYMSVNNEYERKRVGFLDCAETTLRSLDIHTQEPSEYYKGLYKDNRECVGLHTISYKNDRGAHIVAWTAVAEGYLFFDANKGELLFEDYFDLIKHIDETIFLVEQRGCANPANFKVTVSDYYFPEDLAALAKMNQSKPRITL